MKRILKIGVTALCLLQASLVYSDNLMDVYIEALKSDPVYLSSEANLKAVQESLKIANANFLPWVDGGASANIDKEGDTNQNYFANLNQTIFNKSYFALNKQAKASIDQAAADFQDALQGLIIRVSERYFDVLAAIDTQNFSDADVEAIGRQLEQTKQRFEVGLVAITDVHEAQARFDSATARSIVAKNEVDNAYERLRAITGTYHENLAVLNKETPLVPPKPNNIDEWTTLALENNISIQSTKYALEVAQQSIKLQSAGHYPTLGLAAGYSSDYGDETQTIDISEPTIPPAPANPPIYQDVNIHTSAYETTFVTLNFNLNFYRGGSISAATRQAKYRYTQALQDLEARNRLAQTNVRSAYLSVVADVSLVKALQQAVVSNESALQATEAGFEVGTRTTVDVLNARQFLLRAAVDLSDARYNYILDRIRLQQAVGKLDEEEVIEINNWLN